MQQSNEIETVEQKATNEEKKSEDFNIKLVPKFMAGIKNEVSNNLFFIDEQSTTVCYPVGHNITLYNIEEKTQRYIPGIEGSEAITALALTKSKRYLAVAERTERTPVCCIYDLHHPLLKRKKVIASTEIKKENKEFISINFSAKNEKYLITLTNSPSQNVFIWQWDKAKLISQQVLSGGSQHTLGTLASFSSTDQNYVLITGPQTFRFYKISDNNSLSPVKTSLNKKEQHISSNYTTHCWLTDGKFLVGTDQGDIILCESTGDYKLLLHQDPQTDGFHIETIRLYSKGFIVGGQDGKLLIFEKTDEPKTPFTRVATLPTASAISPKTPKMLLTLLEETKIKSIDLSSTEDQLIFSTDNQQIIKIAITMERPADEVDYSYLVMPFHTRAINCMDSCIKKPFIATTSIDRTVKVWSYTAQNGFALEIDQLFKEEPYNVAFHPSGFHIVVAFNERIRMMNLYEKTLLPYKDIQIKQCREIKFSHGGHLFAVANQSAINVYKFYFPDQPQVFKGHNGVIKSICWFDDDSGFASSGWDAYIYVWKLNSGSEDNKYVWEYKVKGVNFTCLTAFKTEGQGQGQNKTYIYATDTVRTLRELTQGDSQSGSHLGKETLRFEQQVGLQQVVLMHNRRAIFGGVGGGTQEQTKPGSIQVLRYPFEKMDEVQAHSLPVEQMRISYDNQTLFSCSADGSICVFSITEKDSKKKDKDLPQIQYSQVILIQQAHRNKIQSEIEHLQAEIKQMNKNRADQAENIRQQKAMRIQELQDQIENKKLENFNQYEALEAQKYEAERQFAEREATTMEEHAIELEKRMKDQAEKVEADQQRFIDLHETKMAQDAKFKMSIKDIAKLQKQKIEQMFRDHQLEKDELEATKKTLSSEIELMITKHKQAREETEQHIWDSIDKLKEEQKELLAEAIDKGMQAKGSLTLITNEHNQQKASKQALSNEIESMNMELQKLNKQSEANKQAIASQKSELAERETTIKDKDSRIASLKLKTQELEKFKFVLDYKIKELKKDIKPNAEATSKLAETVTKMEQEVKHFARVKINLELITEDLKLKQDGLQSESKKLREKIEMQNVQKLQFKDEIYDMLQTINDYKQLKKSIVHMYKKYQSTKQDEEGKLGQSGGNSDIHKENSQRRKYLETSLNQVTQRLKKSYETHKQANNKIMTENVQLLQEINSLKQDYHNIKLKLKHSKLAESDKRGSNYQNDSNLVESEEIMQLRMENQKLSEEIALLEKRDAEINDQVRAMSEQAEFSLRLRQQNRERDVNEMPSNMEPAAREPSIDELNTN